MLRTGLHEGQRRGLPNQPSARGTAFRAAFLADTGSRYARNLAVLQLEVAAQIRVRHHRAWYFLADISGQGDNEEPSCAVRLSYGVGECVVEATAWFGMEADSKSASNCAPAAHGTAGEKERCDGPG